MRFIVEGKTKLKVHSAKIPSKRMPVFYNPAKEFDRSLSVEIVKALKPKKTMDLLAASGARGIRLMNEAGVNVEFNDINPLAARLVRRNLKLNNLKAVVHNQNANKLLYDLNEYFDFIDLDPFGTPNPYLDACIKHTSRHGVLAVTATDTAALVGARPEAGYRKYHSRLKRHSFMKETGLRLLIKHVVEKGAELELAMKPIISHSTKHYFRAYFKKDLGARKCDELLNNIKPIHYNPKTGYRGLKPENGSIELGPVYTGSINSFNIKNDFIKQLNNEDKFPPWHYNVVELGYSEEPKLKTILKKHDAIRAHYDNKAIKTNKKIDIKK